MTDITNIIDTVICGENLVVMGRMPSNYFDTIITDPPYGLGFMGKEWDTFKPGYRADGWDGYENQPKTTACMHAGKYDHSRNREFQVWFTIWAQECLRVAKPGTILMAFGGTRTYHRLTCAIEDAGWEIRDCMQWIYGSGFPKSLDISKAIDKAAGAEREVVGVSVRRTSKTGGSGNSYVLKGDMPDVRKSCTAPATPLAQQWNGWGTALKPSWEPIIVGMKPLDGTFAENAEKWGVAGLNIDGARIGTKQRTYKGSGAQPHKLNAHGKGDTGIGYMDGSGKDMEFSAQGRFPSNTILSCTCEDEHEPDCPVRLLDEQSGELTSGAKDGTYNGWGTGREIYGDVKPYHHHCSASSGGASRFFYCAKSSRAERNAGCLEIEAQQTDESRHPDKPGGNNPRNRGAKKSTNFHPTVKPLALMEYLCKLTKTPTGGIVLDPFAGSGTTGIAAYKTNRHYILIEKERDYCKIAERRIQEERDKYALFQEGGE